MEDQLRDLCLRSMRDYIDYLIDVGVSRNRFEYRTKLIIVSIFGSNALNYFEQYTNCGFNIKVVVKNMSITFEPTFKVFMDGLLMLLNSFYEAVTTLPRAEAKLKWIYSDTGLPELLKVRIKT